jgi:hypothetical protein
MLPHSDAVTRCLEQLRAFLLMTRDYFTTICSAKKHQAGSDLYQGVLDATGTRSETNWKSKWNGKVEGIGALLEFSKNMLDWFLEMDRNGFL